MKQSLMEPGELKVSFVLDIKKLKYNSKYFYDAQKNKIVTLLRWIRNWFYYCLTLGFETGVVGLVAGFCEGLAAGLGAGLVLALLNCGGGSGKV